MVQVFVDTIPVIIGFLASLDGLGEKVQGVVDIVIQKAGDWSVRSRR